LGDSRSRHSRTISNKFAEAFPTARQDEETAATLLIDEIILRYGAPKQLLSDRGTAFLSRMATSAYHPQTNGITERMNKTLVSMLRTYANDNQDDWDVTLRHVMFAI